MNKKNLETFMYIGFDKILISIFSKDDSKVLYQNEHKFFQIENKIDEIIIINFLNENIFQIEKKFNQFINDINLIINSNQFLSINLSIKQNIYNSTVSKKDQIILLNDLKNYINDNYTNYSIIHYLINHYLFDNNFQKEFDFKKKCNHFCLDATFILLNKENIFFYKKIFEKFQIAIKKVICCKYILDTFDSNKFNECEMGLKISSGFNPNEVFSIQKNTRKRAFFERFFNFFS